MTLLIVGINHKTAAIDIREKIAFTREHKLVLLNELLSQTEITEAVVLSTCNRTELYTNSIEIDPVITSILNHSTISLEELQASLYVYKDLAAVEHIMSVACGLDSMVIGEQQILGQMKAAINLAAECNAIHRHFQSLFQRVFSLAKYVRTTTQIGACPVSIASIAVNLAQQTFPDINQQKILLIGSGDTIRLVAKYLHGRNIYNIVIASRNIDNAQKLAENYDCQAIALTELSEHLCKADIIMSATASAVPILGKGRIESALKQRNNKPLFLIDLALPRDIEPEVKELKNVYLYTIDDLKSLAQTNVRSREHAAKQAHNIIKEHAADYMQWLNGLESTDIIKAFRNHIETIRHTEQMKAYRLLEQGNDPKAVIDFLANSFAQKLMHKPSIQIRQACEHGRKEILHTVQEIFAINTLSEKISTDTPN
ncbi:MAG: glutamyl-tRNA reductase [Gammaproteobacteria bacterium RIFCSPHIGHO2_12_FULL_35_23]|nr:MAG: glutamyl-tRNA reductase [Gammaproteobacteria bacterium RIFCSPHIGHO2_12_FULL_35_23]